MSDSSLTKSDEKYTLGYAGSALDWMKGRTAEDHGAFLLPHLKAGMALLDCGCGPGTLTIGYAQKIAPGVAIGIDKEVAQTATVAELATKSGITNLQFQNGDLYKLPFPDNHFDVVFASAVLGSVANARKVVTEMVRVLKPGGVIGLKEFDHGGDLISPQPPAIKRSVELYHQLRAANGHEAAAGRRLKEFLHDANCTIESYEVSYAQHRSRKELETLIELNNGLFYEVLGPQYFERGWCTPVELDEQVAAWRDFAANPAAVYCSAWAEAVGFKKS